MFGRISTRLTILGICFAAGCGDAGGSPDLGDDTGSEALHTVETVPAPLETDVDTDVDLSVLFDEPLSPDAVTSDSVTLESSDGAHSGTVALAAEEMVVFTPGERLGLLTEYTATVHGVEGQSGAALLEEHHWRFSTRDGRWASEEEVSNTSGGHTTTRVAVGPNGEMIAMWVERGSYEQVWSNRYSPDAGWGMPERVDALEAGDMFAVAVAFDDDGNAIAAWLQSGGFDNSIWTNRYSPTTGWGVAQGVGTTTGIGPYYYHEPSLAVHPDGHAFVVWGNMDELRGCQFAPATGWTAEEIIHRGTRFREPYVVAGPNATATLLTSDSDGERTNIWSARYDATSGWGSLDLVETDDHGSAQRPRAVVDSSGNVTAVWQQSDSIRYNIWANRYTPGEGWGTAQRIEASNAGGALKPRLGVDATGNVLAVWHQSDGASERIWSNRYTVADGWGVAGVLGGNDSDGAGLPEVVVDPRGNAVATWGEREDRLRSVSVNRFTPTTGWGTQENLGSPSNHVRDPALGIGRDGRVIAIWDQWSDTESEYSVRVRRFE